MWRPKDWEKILVGLIGRVADVPSEKYVYLGERAIFEAGADAMYPHAHRKGVKETLEWCKDKHYLVDYDLDKFILQLEKEE